MYACVCVGGGGGETGRDGTVQLGIRGRGNRPILHLNPNTSQVVVRSVDPEPPPPDGGLSSVVKKLLE